MSENNFDKLLTLLNHQTEFQENLTEELAKANAMAQLTLSENFLDYSKSIIHSYLWALCDAIEKAKDLSEHILETLLKSTPLDSACLNELKPR